MNFNKEVDVSKFDDHSSPVRVCPDGTVEMNEFELGYIDDLFCEKIKKIEEDYEEAKDLSLDSNIFGLALLNLRTVLARFRAMSSARW